MGTSYESRSRRSTFALVAVFVVAAVALRAYRLGSPVMWVDEAESSLNALTIVADGLPGDRFLGLPLYENTLVKPWAESAEYEFRDISYSDRGLAVYHSWLPLYSIAAAFRLSGVTPEAARHGTPLRDASEKEIRYWSAVPRVPAVVFGALSVAAAWALGRRVQGDATAAAMSFAVATSDFFVYAGRQARYYSASVLFSTLCGLAIWNAWRRGRLLDHAVTGLAIGLLFHVHSVSAIAMVALYLAVSPMGRQQPRLWLRMLTAGTVCALLVLPWAAWSGFLSQTSWTPAARHVIDVRMVLSSLPTNPVVWCTVGAGLAWFAAAVRPTSRLSQRWRGPTMDSAPGFYFAFTWFALSYLLFFAAMPAVSVFPYRLNLMIAVPLMLALSLLVAAISRSLRPSSVLLPAAGIALILVLWNELPPRFPRTPEGETSAFIGMIRSWELAPGGRLFASPNDHLTLTYYSGRPVQSIFPVRRKWLDEFDDDLIILEGSSYDPLSTVTVHETAQRLGRGLTEAEAESRAREARLFAIQADLQASGVSVVNPLRQPDDLDQALADAVREATRLTVREFVKGTLYERDAGLSTWQDFRIDHFYWFSERTQRTGPQLNYRACRAAARAILLSNGYTVLDCRAAPGPSLLPAPP